MAEEQLVDLGLVDSIRAVTIGEPGQRTFNISARSSRGQAVIWMEKDQLLQLSFALQQLSEKQERPDSPSAFAPEYAHTGGPVSVEFKAGDMRVRYDGESDVFTVEATDPDRRDEEGDAEEERVAVQFSFGRAAAVGVAEEGQKIVAAGRPYCPYCHSPIDPDGHVCPRSNGHSKSGIPVE
ncbi:MAG TPA: DUF3090 family protein [Dehalococcoidia bacterium]|nr:hypothetical protein [Chloroflexota bacterium]MDP5876783.1 DUF3090 family protein [Dehalococcoidia bacterium]MDP7160122.1 DUF3090 family protein [Dehalococcoidia bacterium]MDP7213367.1 DUF3090 family protein [Dehalococcoidia bacterium]MDP7514070.1 DUF3090 family protein [Dehalococcoidia bacterium]